MIIGTARDRKTKAPLALLARADAPGLAYAGSAFIALCGTDRAELSARLQKSERCPIPKLRFPDAQWVKPQLTGRAHPRSHQFVVAPNCIGPYRVIAQS